MQLPAELVARFAAHLADAHQDVEALQARLDTSPGEAASAREKLRALAHKLAGTAEPFGFSLLGARARALEIALMQGLGSGAETHEELQEFQSALANAVHGLHEPS